MSRISIIILVLFLFAGCSGNIAPPEMLLLKAPETATSHSKQEIVWQVTLPTGVGAAVGQFSLHTDDRSHTGNFGIAVSPELAGYQRVLETDFQITEDGKVLLTYSIQELLPTIIYYRFHFNIDGNHYWSPERLLTIIPRPAFTNDFRDSLIDDAIEELSLF